jgi:Tetratricopeptide repeat
MRDRLVAYQAADDPVLLDEAVDEAERLIRLPGFDHLSGASRAYVWTLGSRALTLRARTSTARTDDLDRSIDWAARAVKAWPATDPNLPRAHSNLATALCDRYERDGDQRDIRRAIKLLEEALPQLRAAGQRLDVTLHSYGVCEHELAGATGNAGFPHLDRAIELFTEALDQPEPSSDERAGYLNSLGLSQRAKGRALADPNLLAKASGSFEQARRAARLGGEAFIAASINLAAVLQDRAEADNDLGALQDAVRIYRDVLPLLEPAEQRRFRVMANLATALIDLYRHTRDRVLLDEATRELRMNAEQLPDGPSRQIVLANLGAALHDVFEFTGRVAVLDEAIAVQELLLAPPNPRLAERMLNLGVSLLARFRRRRASQDLDRAIARVEDTERRSTYALERASAVNSQANARSLRFDEFRDPREIDRCIELREKAVATAPKGTLDRALYEGNLGVDLLKRYELHGTDADLWRAVECQQRAVGAITSESTYQPTLLAGLADSLASKADRTLAVDDLESARATYRQAIDAGMSSLPEQALGAAVRWGDWESRHQRWAIAVAAYRFAQDAVRQVVAGQQVRKDKESWLAEAQGIPAAAGLAATRAGDPTQAVLMLEDGRAVLLAEALDLRQFVSVGRLTAADRGDGTGSR